LIDSGVGNGGEGSGGRAVENRRKQRNGSLRIEPAPRTRVCFAGREALMSRFRAATIESAGDKNRFGLKASKVKQQKENNNSANTKRTRGLVSSTNRDKKIGGVALPVPC